MLVPCAGVVPPRRCQRRRGVRRRSVLAIAHDAQRDAITPPPPPSSSRVCAPSACKTLPRLSPPVSLPLGRSRTSALSSAERRPPPQRAARTRGPCVARIITSARTRRELEQQVERLVALHRWRRLHATVLRRRRRRVVHVVRHVIERRDRTRAPEERRRRRRARALRRVARRVRRLLHL